MHSLFTLAGFNVLRAWELPNKYQGPYAYYYQDTGYRRDPWWLVKTEYGLIEIGWRKRVISIDWDDTDLLKTITADDVTKRPTMVHAWSIEKALEYLRALRKALESHQTPAAVARTSEEADASPRA